MSDEEQRRLARAAGDGDLEAAEALAALLRRREAEEGASIRAVMNRTNMGGVVSLSRDAHDIEELCAVRALSILWPGAGERVLEMVKRLNVGQGTGATFTGTLEDYRKFEEALAQTGIGAEILSKPPTEDFVRRIAERG